MGDEKRAGFFIISICLVSILLYASSRAQTEDRIINSFKLAMANTSQNDQATLFRDLVRREGPIRAQKILHETLPGTSRAHLIARQAGAYLYATEGEAGLKKCLPYFLAGCHEGFVAAAIADTGTVHAKELLAQCTKSLEHFQTLHCEYGLGEGLVRHAKHDLGDALSGCKMFSANGKELERCFRGVFEPFAELRVDKPTAPLPTNMYSSNDPMYPCNEKIVVGLGAHHACWERHAQQTLNKQLYPVLNADIGHVASYCEHLDDKNRAMCMRGLAGQIQFRAGMDITQIKRMCAEVGDTNKNDCVNVATARAYYFDDGSSDPRPFLATCAQGNANVRDVCFKNFFIAIANRFSGEAERVTVCGNFGDEPFENACLAWMKSAEAAKY
jgi:hypothetical protein